jgi:hypothetical protein
MAKSLEMGLKTGIEYAKKWRGMQVRLGGETESRLASPRFMSKPCSSA